MTPQEESMLNDLIGRVEQTQLTEKDPEAEQVLNQRLGRNPNALYILSQTVLVQKYALEQAQAQLDQLRQQTQALQQQPAHSTSFLGNLLGHRDPAPPPPPPPPPPGYGAPPYGQPWNQAPAYGAPPPVPGGGSSFLRTAATTAAGVAAGALAFQGVESLLGGFGHSAGFGGGSGLFGGAEARPEETVINNYYDDSGREHERVDNSGLGNSGSDAADLQQASDDLRDDGDNQDDLSLDDTSYDDSSFDDSSSGGDDLA
ncbi:MAG TPA: DUF2076 domain-containing protein [Acidobacteriaceae bacterium]|jgi:hypothetical protein|nr:DUF2076 domain-containing protein [Acidobacteriaceae bacterium]